MRHSTWLAGAMILGLFLLGTSSIGCKKDSPTQPVQQLPPGTLFLSRLSVALVPGGTETVTITA